MQYVSSAATGAYMGYLYNKAGRRQKARISAKNLAIQNSNQIRRIKGGLLHELKTHDTSTATAVSSTGAIKLLTAIAQGDTSLTRDGLEIRPKNLQVRVRLIMSASARASQVRIIIFKDTEQHGLVPTIAQLLEADDAMVFTEHDTRPRFQILRDKMYVMSLTGEQIVFDKFFIKLRGKINFSGTSASSTSMGKNTLYMYIVSNEATNTVIPAIFFRLRFTDG